MPVRNRGQRLPGRHRVLARAGRHRSSGLRRRIARESGMGELGRPAVIDITRDHEMLPGLDRRGVADLVGLHDRLGRNFVAVRQAGNRLALGDDDGRAALPVPMAAVRRRHGTGHVGSRRRRLVLRCRRILRCLLVLRQRLALDLSDRRGLPRRTDHLVGRRPPRIGSAIRTAETGGVRAACRSADRHRGQSPPTKCPSRTPPCFFTPHNRTHTHTPHHTPGS